MKRIRVDKVFQLNYVLISST